MTRLALRAGHARPALRLLVLTACLVCPGIASGQAAPREPPRRGSPERSQGAAQFRVCSDPDNMPFSNRRLEGFENKIADLVAKDLGATTTYTWWGQRRGFIRNTMNATLQEGRCDVVIGAPEKYDLVRTTTPYYRSTYVFVYPKGKGPAIRSLDDPALAKLKIGVHLLGDDYTNPPPVHELAKRGIVDNVVGFSTFYSDANPPSAIIDAVAKGRVDIAIVWGPVAGYFAARQAVPLHVVAVPSGKSDLPFAFDISMGVKPGNEALRTRLEQVIARRHVEIARILQDYGVPLLERKASPKR
jgi:quinoprotein dehydrogenase-associated probable ABC transporter substrate-binding protein